MNQQKRSRKGSSKNRSGKRYNNVKGKKFKDAYEAEESNVEMKRDRGFRTSNNPGNDPSFYSGNPDLITSAYSINFSYPAGVVQKVGTQGRFSQFTATSVGKTSIPAIVTASIIPAFGRNENINDALNVVAQQVYTQMRAHNSGARNYDANDLALFVLGMADVYSYINYLIRLYAIITMPYEPMNRSIPRYLCEANHADYDDLIGNAAQFLYSINLLIDKAASFIVPSAFKLFLRRASIYSKCFIESESVRDQIYMYVPDSFYRFTLDGDKAGKLALTEFAYGHEGFSGAHHTMQQLISYGNMLINDYFEYNDSALISGDLERAFGSSIYTLSHVPQTVSLDFTTDINVLNQFKNATPLSINWHNGAATYYSHFDVTQNPTKAVLLTKPWVAPDSLGEAYRVPTISGSEWGEAMMAMYDLDGGQQLFSFENPVPTTDDIIEATRLHFGWSLSGIQSTGAIYLYPGSEIVNKITVWYPNINTDAYASRNIIQEYPLYYKATENPGYEQLLNLLQMVAVRRSMKWLPSVHMHRLVTTGNNITPSGTSDNEEFFLMQISNFTYVDQTVLKRMHEAVLIDQLFIKYI